MADTSLALVIGANRGIGLGVVRQFLRRGWSVIATARRPTEAAELKSLSLITKDRLDIRALDMNNTGQIDAFVADLADKTFDVVLVNGGVAGPEHMSASKATQAEIGALMFTNAIAPIRIARALAGSIRPKTGVLAFTSSMMGSVGLGSDGYHELYRASKAALNSLSRGLWSEVKDRDIAVLTLHPGWVRTDMGGDQAPVGVEDSASGLVSVIENERGKHHHAFLDFQGHEVAW
jgi:NAD(P)-dependent dehydrogenase (short-subunit alcohol dehydrogenase family)